MEIEFHSGIADKLGFACRLLRKAHARGARVVVTGAPRALAELDAALWTFEPQGFVPHVRLARGASPAPRLARTPLWLVEPGTAPPHREVLVNLGPEMPEGFAGFARVIELVAADVDDRDAGQRRWRAYKAQGVAIKHLPQTAG